MPTVPNRYSATDPTPPWKHQLAPNPSSPFSLAFYIAIIIHCYITFLWSLPPHSNKMPRLQPFHSLFNPNPSPHPNFNRFWPLNLHKTPTQPLLPVIVTFNHSLLPLIPFSQTLVHLYCMKEGAFGDRFGLFPFAFLCQFSLFLYTPLKFNLPVWLSQRYTLAGTVQTEMWKIPTQLVML